eukprot:757747-Hanusia_phi.AAC.6
MLAPKVARIFPRKRRGDADDDTKREVVLTAVEITNLFHMRQSEAADHLVSFTCPYPSARSPSHPPSCFAMALRPPIV